MTDVTLMRIADALEGLAGALEEQNRLFKVAILINSYNLEAVGRPTQADYIRELIGSVQAA